MAHVTTVVSGQPVKNNNSTMLYGGNVTGIKSIALGKNSVKVSGVLGYTATTGIANNGAVHDGTADEVLALGACTKIKGTANTRLSSSYSAVAKKSIHGVSKRYSIVVTSWDMLTGDPTIASNSQNDFGTDNATTVTAAVPGNIVFLSGASTTTKSY